MGQVPSRVLVVIPYFQRESGILARALRSIAAQRLPQDAALDVLVVDDASPTPAEPEIAAVPMQAPHRMRLLRRPNGGAGAARNTALDEAGPEHECIALLDSDDSWHPDHLARLLGALGQGFDVHFADHDWPGIHGSAFALRQFGRGFGQDGGFEDGLGSLTSAEAVSAFVRTCPGQTSTLGWRRAVAPALRFRGDVRVGEDVLFFCQLMARARRIAFSNAITVSRGLGVNIHASNQGWDAERTVWRAAHSLRARRALRSDAAIRSTELLGLVRRQELALERDLAWLAFRALLLGRLSEAAEITQPLREDLGMAGRIPAHLLRVALGKLRGTYSCAPS